MGTDQSDACTNPAGVGVSANGKAMTLKERMLWAVALTVLVALFIATYVLGN